mmetsp:Transcript_10086/g.14800  ORF Transcript_10086/g.14800 Transcript_10086/m.14800 type:complete len:113 (+) Transcript_10086:191-529(+)|eukprot:CAMPEP_0197246970 /NCGR_PEP_ID=MMETSP1429-20130617/24729_1 /TAXON_ID=49237 /ORGANISM="Chaetoceros  sp., Strain UNC1202" /LENGTH=112 /DNA_ID=CAMNT_0042707767 /DNA_START=86 /DNA_END=424 /DNA_ORIENTATION=+
MGITSIITPVGIIAVLHSAYSCLHYRSILSSSNLDLLESGYTKYNPSKPPQDVVIECLIGFTLCLIGQLIVKGHFIPVVSSTGTVKAAVHISRDFDLFATRAGIIASVKQKN